MATRADIEINVKGLKKVQELSKQLDKVSGKVNQLNKGGAASKSNKLEKESASLQEKKRASMVRVRSMTMEELLGWSAYFLIINEEQEKEFEKAKRRR